MTSSSERRYDLDWLRALGVLLLIPFHAALIFVLDPNAIMYIKDVVNSRVLEVAVGFVHVWHMPMLFIISGSATYFALGFRSAGRYVRERFLRLFIPLVFGILTFVPFTTYIQHGNIHSLQEGYIGYFHFDLNHLDGLNGTFTPAHLWFSVLTGYFAIQLHTPVAVKYPLIVVVATGLTLVAHELVRRWNMTRWLFGMKPHKQGMSVASNAKLDRQLS